VKNQRTIFAKFEVVDFSNVKRVVTCGVAICHPGDEVGDCSVDERDARTINKLNLQPLLRPACKMRAQRFLMFGENADAESPGALQNSMHIRAVVE
jgi:hypothetical protein